MMALITCKDCGKEFSTDAKRCPNCGAKPPKEGGGGCLVPVIVLLFGLLFGVALLAVGEGNRGTSSSSPKNPREYVLSTCRNFIKDSLHDPSSVEFDRTYPKAEQLPEDKYRVTVPLRAKNGFGAMRHFAVECTVKADGEKFYLVGLKELD